MNRGAIHLTVRRRSTDWRVSFRTARCLTGRMLPPLVARFVAFMCVIVARSDKSVTLLVSCCAIRDLEFERFDQSCVEGHSQRHPLEYLA